jgi:hypothetical protein
MKGPSRKRTPPLSDITILRITPITWRNIVGPISASSRFFSLLSIDIYHSPEKEKGTFAKANSIRNEEKQA